MKEGLLKKIILVVLVYQPFVSCYANFFAGGNVAYLNGEFNHSLRQRVPLGPITFIHDKNDHLAFGGNAGYQFIFNKYNLAIAGFYNSDHLLHTKVGSTTTTKKYLIDDYGVKAIPGFYLTPKLNLQTILGLSIGHLKYFSFGTRNKYLNIYHEPGFVVGGGIDYQLSSFLHAGLIYEYTKYHRKNNVNGDHGFNIRNGSTDTNRVMLTLSYFFDSSKPNKNQPNESEKD